MMDLDITITATTTLPHITRPLLCHHHCHPNHQRQGCVDTKDYSKRVEKPSRNTHEEHFNSPLSSSLSSSAAVTTKLTECFTTKSSMPLLLVPMSGMDGKCSIKPFLPQNDDVMS